MLWAGIVLPQLALDGALRHQPPPDARAAPGPDEHGLPAPRPEKSTAALLELIAAWAYRYSSLVSLEGEDAVVLEVEASLGLFGPWPRFRASLMRDLTALGFRHRIALAPTPLAACVLASAGRNLAITRPSALASALGPVPLTAARLPAGTGEGLARMGVYTLRQLLDLPRAGLRRRCGPALPQYIARLCGESPDPRQCYQPPDFFLAKLEFNHELVHHTALLFPLRRMIDDLATWLGRREGGVQHLELQLEHAHAPTTTLAIGLLAPTRDPVQLLELCRVRLEQTQLPAPIQGLCLLARDLPPFNPAPGDLFARACGDGSSWEVLRERLRARLGEDALFQLQPHADARPEHSLRTVPLLAREPAPAVTPRRPTWLLNPPVPWRGVVREILAGPERIEAGWWDEADIRRDYYVVETSQGQRAWLFREAGSTAGEWMLHGWFA